MRMQFYSKRETQQNYPRDTKQTPFFPYHCIPAIILQSVYKTRKENDDKYFPQTYLEECMYTGKILRKEASKEN